MHLEDMLQNNMFSYSHTSEDIATYQEIWQTCQPMPSSYSDKLWPAQRNWGMYKMIIRN